MSLVNETLQEITLLEYGFIALVLQCNKLVEYCPHVVVILLSFPSSDTDEGRLR